MKLYGYWRSSTSYRVRIALNLKGAAYETIPVNLLAGEHRSPAFLDINPAGALPALEMDGAIYSQSLAIFDVLEDSIPTPSLWPSGPTTRALARELTYAIATEIHAPNNMRNLKWLRENLVASDRQIVAWQTFILRATLAPIEATLAARGVDGLPFGAPGAFEAVLTPQLYNARRFNLDLTSYPTLVRIDAACNQFDAFQRAAPENQKDAPRP